MDSETGFAAALGCARRKSDERRGCADADNEAATTPAIRRSSQPAARRVALSAATMGIGTTTKGRVRTPTRGVLLFAFISLNREAARAELDVHAFGLMAVLIKLITQYGDGDRKRADDKIKHVGASHGGVPRRNRFLADRQSSSSADSCRRNLFNHMRLLCDVRLFFSDCE